MSGRRGAAVVLVALGIIVGGATQASAPVPAGHCTLRHVGPDALPDVDLRCTPGAVNPDVTPASIGRTICTPGWTRTIRPGSSVTRRLRTRVAAAYGIPPDTRGELDHLISLELGGHPTDPANLWIEPGPIPNGKDAVENALKRAVCSGRVPLYAAQVAIATDWTTALQRTTQR